MRINDIKHLSKKAVSIICAAVIIVGCIPSLGGLSVFGGSGKSKTVKKYNALEAGDLKYFDFEPTADGTNTLTTGKLNGTQLTSYDTAQTGNHNVWSVVNDNGNHVLAIKDPGNNVTGTAYQPAVLLLNDGMTVYSLKPGTKYTVSLRYKLVNVGTLNNAWFYISQSPTKGSGVWGSLQSAYNAFGSAHSAGKDRILGNFNGTSVSNGSVKDINGNVVKLNTWNTVSYTFTAQDYGNGNNVGIATCSIPGLELYIDDIAFSKSNLKQIVFDSNGGTAVKMIAGEDDDTIVMPPDPTNGSLEFMGWFTDKELKTPFTAKKFSELKSVSTTLYAKWREFVISDSEIFDFEGGSTIASGKIGSTDVSSHDDASGKNNFVITKDSDGNGVLEIRYPSNAGVHYKNGSFILNKDGKIPQLVEGKKYTVSMRVKINTLNTAAKARVVFVEDIITGDTGMPGEFGTVLGDSSAFANKYIKQSRLNTDYMLIKDINNGATPVKDINNDTVPIGEWHTITKTFTAYPSKTNGNLYIGLTACTGTGFSMYVDDIQIIDASKKIISFNTDGGGNINNIIADEDDKITLPTVMRDGFEFLGWYTDAALTKKASDPFTVGKESVTLYAKWKNVQGILIDFEGAYSQNQTDVSGWSSFGGAFALNREGQKSHGTVPQYSADGCFGGNSSLIINYSGTSDYSSALLRNKMFPSGISARAGEKYRVTLKYKTASGNIAGAKLTIAEAASAPTGWYKVTRYENGGAYTRNSSEWQTATFIYKNETDATQFLHLAIDINGAADSKASVYVDNISLNLIDEDVVTVAVDNQDGAETAFYFGKPGEAFSLPAPAAREGFTFLYWATDKDGKNRFTSSVFPDKDTNLYAIWDMVLISTGFENYPSAWNFKGTKENLNPRLTRFGEISENIARTGSRSMHITLDEDIKATDYTYFALDYSSKNMTLQNNTRYKVTVWYNAETLAGDLNLYAATSASYSLWGGLKQYSGSGAAVKASNVGKGWQKAEFIFKTDFDKDNLNCLYLLTTGWNNPSSVYFDDVSVEKISSSQSVVTFVRGDGNSDEYSVKNIGTAISFPQLPDREYYTFAGWYTDAAFTKKFGGTVHTAEDMTLYAKWDFKKGVKIKVGFEDYNFALPKNTKIVSNDKSEGSKSLYFDCGSEGSVFAIPLNLGNEYLTVANGQRFAVSFDYKLNNAPIDAAKQLSLSFFTAKTGFGSSVQQTLKYNYTEGQKGMRWWIRTTAITEEWLQYSDTVTIEKANSGNILYFVLHQGDSVSGYIDNITLTPVNDGEVVVTTDKVTASGRPYYIGKKGQTVKLDQNLTRPGNFKFIGWFIDKDYQNEAAEVKLNDDTRVFASWARDFVDQGFEDFEGIPGISMMGSDYEVYGPSTAGYDKSNVHGGKYSLHRKGDSRLWQNVQLLNTKTMIGAGTKYTMSFWIKMDKGLHTDGAVRITSCKSIYYPYDAEGDYFDVIAIEDLADNRWHKVEYTFDSFTGYVSIQTPGYLSLYIDDVHFKYAGKDATVSTPVKVKNEYKPLLRNPDGSLANAPLEIKDTTLVSHKPKAAAAEEKETGNGVLITVLICVGAVIVAAGGAVTVIVLKRKGKPGRKSTLKK